MMEYKVIVVRADRAEEEMNRLARDGWRVVSTAVHSGITLITSRAPMVITLRRDTTL